MPPKPFTLTTILAALGHPIRLAMVAQLSSCPDGTPMNCAKAAETLKDLPLSTRHHHMRILREAGIIATQRQGVNMLNTLRKTELEQAFPGLFDHLLTQAKRSH